MKLTKGQILGYALAFISPIFGIIAGLWLSRKETDETRGTGKKIIILSVIMGIAWSLVVLKPTIASLLSI